MKNKKFVNGGYVGLLMLLISVAIVVFIIIRLNFSNVSKSGQNQVQQDLNAINQAKAIKDIIEKDNQKTTEGL